MIGVYLSQWGPCGAQIRDDWLTIGPDSGFVYLVLAGYFLGTWLY
jgi:hypothetical protein